MPTADLPQTESGDCGGGNVIGAAGDLLDQCGQVVDAVSDADYSALSEVMPGGTIGKHLRHTLDHFAAIVTNTDDEPIDYDHRVRGVPIEDDRAAARDHIASLRVGISDLEGTGADQVRIRVMIAADGGEAVLDSTVAREVVFATHHGVHHVAMMKTIARELGVEFGADIGKAPSTINFERAGA